MGPWNDSYQSATESGSYHEYAEHVASTLLRPNPQGLQQVTSLIRDFIGRLQSLAWNYGEINVKDRIALFVIRENAFLTETGTEVTERVDPKSIKGLGLSSSSRQVSRGEVEINITRLLSYFTDRLRVDLLNSGNNFPKTTSQLDNDTNDLQGSYARSRVFGPDGLERIPDDQITPLRREDQDVMGHRRPNDPMPICQTNAEETN